MHTKRIIIVDDHALVRAGIITLIQQRSDLEVVGEAATAADAISLAERLVPDLVIVDVSLDVGMNGIELLKHLRAKFPLMALLVVSMHDEELYGERALLAGANGFVMKRATIERLSAAIDTVLAGRVYASADVEKRMRQRSAARSRGSGDNPLSDRELEVLELIGRGLGTREIAATLHLSVKTVETYRAHLKLKLAIETAPQLLRYAVQWVESR